MVNQWRAMLNWPLHCTHQLLFKIPHFGLIDLSYLATRLNTGSGLFVIGA